MASPIHVLRSHFRSPISLGLCLGSGCVATATMVFLAPTRSRLLHCDSGTAGPTAANGGMWSSASKARHPATSTVGSARTYRQISSGSICGLLAGLAIGTFSRSLSLLLGLVLFGVQFAASHGLHVIPYKRIQRYIGGINLRSALDRNVAFKLSFGLTFALAAFVPL
ncbi:MAG: hypothetical protein M1826_005512 [Phylliscum demangeonii]|nr:MAG: hypothetical protein M1826_005512 [Phylliscum demangeonii]